MTALTPSHRLSTAHLQRCFNLGFYVGSKRFEERRMDAKGRHKGAARAPQGSNKQCVTDGEREPVILLNKHVLLDKTH